MKKQKISAKDIVKWRVLSKITTGSEFSQRKSTKHNPFIARVLNDIDLAIEEYKDLLKII